MFKSNQILLGCVCLLGLTGVGLGAAVAEKREMPSNGGYGGGYGGGYEAVAPYGGQMQAAPQQSYGPPAAPQYGGGGGAPYTNPGFSVQTGFEGFLVPNSWYGLLPWGIEGVVVVIVGVIVFIVISVVILGLLAWLTGFGDYAIVKESARNYLPSHINFEAIADVTNTVLDALDKYDELQVKKIE